jgi:glutaminyl-tRNA synthetase
LNFAIAAEFKGSCNLRFDDTNPTKEDIEYVEFIQEDVRWPGFDWEDRLYFASDYFELLHAYTVPLIQKGKAHGDSPSADEIRDYRHFDGTGERKPLPRSLRGRKPGSFRMHASGLIL